jgi:exocyst complex component 1
VGVLAALDYCVASSEKMNGEFLARTAEKQYQRYLAIFNRQTVCSRYVLLYLTMIDPIHPRMQKEQLKAVEQTKLTVKKRKGVVSFIRVFPVRSFARFSGAGVI